MTALFCPLPPWACTTALMPTKSAVAMQPDPALAGRKYPHTIQAMPVMAELANTYQRKPAPDAGEACITTARAAEAAAAVQLVVCCLGAIVAGWSS